jgi:hypothetical protein
MKVKCQAFGGEIPSDAVSVGRETHLGKGLKCVYKDWLWYGMKRENAYVMAQLNAIEQMLRAKGSVTLLHEAGDEEIAQLVGKAVLWKIGCAKD